jgi:hypothetical protein
VLPFGRSLGKLGTVAVVYPSIRCWGERPEGGDGNILSGLPLAAAWEIERVKNEPSDRQSGNSQTVSYGGFIPIRSIFNHPLTPKKKGSESFSADQR